MHDASRISSYTVKFIERHIGWNTDRYSIYEVSLSHETGRYIEIIVADLMDYVKIIE